MYGEAYKEKGGEPEGSPPQPYNGTQGRTNLNSKRMNLSGSKHRGLSQHLQYLDSTGSSVQDFPVPRCGQHSTLTPSTSSREHVTLGRNHLHLFLVSWDGKRTPHISMDSSLEAFSGNPTDGSFTALVFQPAVLTKYLNELFLSY